jgi:hypothetical protein
VVLRYADRSETGVTGHLAYADVPANLRDEPTPVVHLGSGAGAGGLAREEGHRLDAQSLSIRFRREGVAKVQHLPRQARVGWTGEDDGQFQVGMLVGVAGGATTDDAPGCHRDPGPD